MKQLRRRKISLGPLRLPNHPGYVLIKTFSFSSSPEGGTSASATIQTFGIREFVHPWSTRVLRSDTWPVVKRNVDPRIDIVDTMVGPVPEPSCDEV